MDDLKRKTKKYSSKTNGEHRFGVGKQFLKEKRVYLEDATSSKLEMSEHMAEYLQKCQEEGLVLNKLELGLFKAKNGFAYEGFRATEQIDSSEILIKVPRKLILTTKVCFFSDIQVIIKENLAYFSTSKDGSLSEDLIMLVFLLRQYQIGRTSPWYLLVANLSRDIDTVDFWENDEYALLDDHVFHEKIKIQRKYFDGIYEKLHAILVKYPDLFDEGTICERNVRWIYVHLSSRCFGGIMDYVSMVPIVEMMNHENTNMFFRLHSQPAEIEKVEITEEERAFHTSTDNESYQSSDTILVNEGDIDHLEELQAQVAAKILKVDQANPKLKDIKRHTLEIENGLLNDFDLGDYTSIFFASRVLEKIKKIESSAIAGKQKPNKLQEEITKLKAICSNYVTLVRAENAKPVSKSNAVVDSEQKKVFEADAKAIFKQQELKHQAQAEADTKAVQIKADSIPVKSENETSIIPTTETKDEVVMTPLNLGGENVEKTSWEIIENDQQQSMKSISPMKVVDDQVELVEAESGSVEDGSINEREVEKKEEDQVQEEQAVVTEKKKHITIDKVMYSEDPSEWPENDYDNFLLMADEGDCFEKGSQVYFCYNRLSNRSMLSKYGMALEKNKYEFIHLRYNYVQDILEKAPYSLQYIKIFELNTFKRFAITYQRFNMKILCFAKAVLWELETQKVQAIFSPVDLTLEIAGLEKAREIYNTYLNDRMYSMDENEAMLTRTDLNGHKYFATVYRLERQRIIKNQVNLIDVCLHVIRKMKEESEINAKYFEERTPFDENPKDEHQYERNRYYLRKYIQLFPKQN